MTSSNRLQKNLRLTLFGIVIMVVVTAALFFREFGKNQIEQGYEREAKFVNNYTMLWLSKTFEDAEMGLDTIENRIQYELDYASFLNLIYHTTSNVSTVFIGDDHGNFYRYPERFVASDYDPRLRGWYIGSVEKQETIVWSEPYVDHGTGSLAITGSKRIHLSDSLDAVAGVDILLSELSFITKDLKVGESGFVTIVSKEGYIIAHPNEELLGTVFYDLDKKNISLYTEHFEIGDFRIISFVDHSDIQKSLQLLNIAMVIISFLFLLIADRLGVRYIHKIIKPLDALLAVTKDIEKGQYHVKCEATSNDEIGVLINSFNKMIESINENNLEMQALYEELYASEETLQSQYDALFESSEYIKKSEERYKAIFEASKEGLWDSDKDWHFNYLTPNWYEQFLVDSKGQWRDLIHPDDQERVERIINYHINHHTDQYKCEYRVINKNNEYKWIEAIGKARYDSEGQFLGMTGSHLDITVRKNYELRMKEMAFKDELTKIYNRSYFEEYLSDFLLTGGQGALIFTDIDDFKHINDMYGHSFGDEVLIELAQRLKKLFEDQEKYLLARFSGDEFILLIKDVTDKNNITFIVNALTQEIESTLSKDNKFFKVSSSSGITIFPSDGSDVDTLFQNMDIAMYHAKRVSKKTYRFFDDDIKSKALLNMQIENHLKSALYEDEFDVYFQPIISADSQKVSSFEALIRWESKALGFVYPDVFIKIAEKTGLINEMGMMVLDRACSFIKKINHAKKSNYKISVNISVVQLMEDHFANRVLNTIKKYGLSNDQVILEITESMTLESNENIIAKLFYLRNHHVGIALDDFGTGYSSFKNLMGLPLTIIKMDKSIIRDAIYNEHVSKLLVSIVDYAHRTNIEVVAEGIEEASFLDIARRLNVDYLQGYYFSYPCKESEVFDIVDQLS